MWQEGSKKIQLQTQTQIQGGFFNWPPPPHARLNRALVHGLAVHEEVEAS